MERKECNTAEIREQEIEGNTVIRIAIPVWKASLENYRNAVLACGAEPVPVGGDCHPEEYDGLLLPGGADVDPARFGQPNAGSEDIDEERDELEFTVLERFVRAGKPVLGICRGHQLINIYFGGTLIQHLAESPVHRRDAGSEEDKHHMVRAVRGSFAWQLYGEQFVVNSSHHQGNDRLGDGLLAAAWSEDGVNEAICHEVLPIWGVQWHPERMCGRYQRADMTDGSKVLRFFIEQCRKQRV